MTLEITTARPESALLDLPWSTPLADWPSSHIVFLPKGISRHLVRFASLSGRVVAIKETTEEMARREYDMLGNLLEWCKFRRPKSEEPMMAPLRGGKFNDKADRVRPAARVLKHRSTPLGGLRLAVNAVPSVTGLDRMLGK